MLLKDKARLIVAHNNLRQRLNQRCGVRDFLGALYIAFKRYDEVLVAW
ncbi:hypothetical protein AC75_0372 [Escherichia coli 2-474-04_S4_C1]|nr:hypothetical protein AC75_0372 [Escherichia coli 2-474-04_S4_C1]